MSDFNSQNNRAVWFDIPVADLERAVGFYSAVLAVEVHSEKFEDFSFAVIDHKDGNGGCLIPKPEDICSDKGLMLYLNADGRIRDAIEKVNAHGGRVIEDVHPIGPHGFRAIIHDSEGNRLVLHSNSDA